jgi:hypothetical protein
MGTVMSVTAEERTDRWKALNAGYLNQPGREITSTTEIVRKATTFYREPYSDSIKTTMKTDRLLREYDNRYGILSA